jgi:predicted nuclease with TOPRIM domain
MINDYEFLEHDEDYITDLDTINLDKDEYNNIIKNLLEKNSRLENENKKNINHLNIINKKYYTILKDFDALHSNFTQLEKDLYDMECVNVELIKMIKND